MVILHSSGVGHKLSLLSFDKNLVEGALEVCLDRVRREQDTIANRAVIGLIEGVIQQNSVITNVENKGNRLSGDTSSIDM